MYRLQAGALAITLLAIANVAAAGRDVRLVDAVKQNDAQAARALLKDHVDVNARHPDGSTALVWAAYHDNLEMAELLIAAGADVNAANEYGEMPLSVASHNRNAALVQGLLKAGADPNAVKPGGETVLMAAADMGSLELVRVLIAHGANVNARETLKGQTALMWAAVRGTCPLPKRCCQREQTFTRSRMPGRRRCTSPCSRALCRLPGGSSNPVRTRMRR